jgi:hypothetical protein
LATFTIRVQTDRGQDLVEQLAGASDEGLAGGVLVLARPFRNDEDGRLGIAPVYHDVGATVGQLTAPAVVRPKPRGELGIGRRREDGVALLIEDIDLHGGRSAPPGAEAVSSNGGKFEGSG